MDKNSSLVIILALSLILGIGLVAADAITNDLHVNIQATNSTGGVETGTFDFVFNVSNNSNCNVANVVYTNTSRLATDTRGIISHYMPSVSLDYDIQYWLCYYRYNTGGSLNRSSAFKMAKTPYAFRAQNITLSGVEIDSNLEMTGYNVTADYGFFDYLGSLANRVTSLFTQTIDATGNVTAPWFRGKFNFTTVSDYLSFNGSELDFNQTLLNDTIDARDTSYWTQTGSALYYDTGYVGIGTQTPDSILHLKNATGETLLKIEAVDAAGASTVQFADSTGAEISDIYGWIDNSLRFQTGNLDRLTINASGSMGLGTTSPDAFLHINKTGDVNVRLETEDGTGTLSLQFYNDTGEAAEVYAHIDNSLRFQVGDTAADRMTIDKTGQVGIGTATPQNLLNVDGDANITGTLYVEGMALNDTINNRATIYNTSMLNYVNAMNISQNTSIGTWVNTNFAPVSEPLWTANLTDHNATWTTTWAEIDNSTFVEVAGDTMTGDLNMNGQGVWFSANGSLGIGTTSPEFPLDIVSTAGGNMLKIESTEGPSTFVFKAHRNTGGRNLFLSQAFRGTSSSPLALGEDDSVFRILGEGYDGTNLDTLTNIAEIEMEVDGSVSDGVIPGRITFMTYDASGVVGNRMVIKNDGKVGIGTTSPDSGLHINGTGSTPLILERSVTSANEWAFTISNNPAGGGGNLAEGSLTIKNVDSAADFALLTTGTTGNPNFVVKATTGNVGIGTTSPQNLLNVDGDANITGTIYWNGINVSNFNISMLNYVNAMNLSQNTSIIDHMTLVDTATNTSVATWATNTFVDEAGDTMTGKLNIASDFNVTGRADFGGAWQDGGVTIDSGTIYATNMNVANISYLNVTHINVNGSLLPQTGYDNTFDLGNGTERWNDLFLGGNAHINGSIYGNVIYQGGNAVLDTSTNFGGDVSGTYNAIQVLNTQGLTHTNITDAPWIVNGSESDLNVNSSDYWDALNTPADINAADITDDNTYVTVTGDTMTGALNVSTINPSNYGNLTVDTGTLFVDSSADRVGIGTSSPDTLLDVEGGDITIDVTESIWFGSYGELTSFSSSPHQGMKYVADGRSGGWYGSHDFFVNYNGGADEHAMRIELNSATGKVEVGVGTQTPVQNLNVIGSANITGKLYVADMALNDTINNRATIFNTSMLNYVNAMNLSQNTSIIDHMTLVDTATNTSMLNYVNAQDIVFNTSIANWALALDTATNTSMLNYVNAMNLSQNTSIIDHMTLIDTATNTSMLNYVNAMNISQGSWVTTNFAPISEPLWTGNLTDHNATWTTTWAEIDNATFVPYVGATKNVDLGANNLTVDSTVFHVDSNTNRVGIGTTTPDSLLHLRDNDATAYDGTSNDGQESEGSSLTIGNANAGANTFSQLNLQLSDASNEAVARIVGIYAGSHSSDLAFVTEDSNTRAEKMRITQEGYVGIGTASPAVDLDIESSANTEFRIAEVGGGNFSVKSVGGGTILAQLAQDLDIQFNVNDGGVATSAMLIDGATTNVGIGTTTPQNLLNINGTTDTARLNISAGGSASQLHVGAGASGGFIDLYDSSGNNDVKIRSYASGGIQGWFNAGNIGIGTTTPQNTLNVVGDANVTNNMYIGDAQVFTDGSGNMVFRI